MNKVFRSIAGCAAVAVAASAPLAARADSTWELVSLMPFPINDGQTSAWQENSFESLYQAGGGFAAEGREDEQPAATEPTQGAEAFRLEHASWGFGVSELRSDFNLGDCCTDFPAGEIDWEATMTAITNSAAYRDGYLFYVDSATNDDSRVIFTRGGAAQMRRRPTRSGRRRRLGPIASSGRNIRSTVRRSTSRRIRTCGFSATPRS